MFLFPTAFRRPELPGMDMSIVIFAPAESQLTTKKSPTPKSNPGTSPHTHRGERSRIRQKRPPNPLKIQSLPTEMQATAPKSNLGAAELCDRRTETRQKFMEKGEFLESIRNGGEGIRANGPRVDFQAYLKPATPVLNRKDFVHTAGLVYGYDRR
jgi:hypothetical protein